MNMNINNKTLLAIPHESCLDDDEQMTLVCGMMEDIVTEGHLPAFVVEVMGVDYFVAKA